MRHEQLASWAAVARGRGPRRGRRRVRASDVVHVGGRPDGRAARQPSALRLRRPDHPGNDRLSSPRGTPRRCCTPLYKAAGAIDDEELLTFRQARQPARRPSDAPAALGGRGHRLARPGPARRRRHGAGRASGSTSSAYRVWVLCGDSEMAEGSVWEAVEHAAYEHLDNLTADRRRQPARPARAHPPRVGPGRLRPPRSRPSAGTPSRSTGTTSPRSTARTPRPRPPRPAHRDHRPHPARAAASPPSRTGRACTASRCRTPTRPSRNSAASATIRVEVQRRPPPEMLHAAAPGSLELPRFDVGDAVATRNAYGQALAALGTARGDVVALDGEVGDSTRTEYFAKEHPDRYFECYIAEQQLVAAAVGMQARGWVPYASTFAAFLTRAHDFVRMAAVSRADINLVGSHAGVAIGQDGPSQMGLEDLAMFRAVHGSTVLYPCDANQTAQLVAAMAEPAGRPLPAHHARRHARHLRPRRAVPGRRQQGAARHASSDRRHPRRRRGHRPRGARGRRRCWPARASPVRVIDLYSVKPVDAARAARRPPTDRPPAHRRGPPPGGRPRRRGRRRLRRRPPGARASCGSPSAPCPARPPRGAAARGGIDAEAIAAAGTAAGGARDHALNGSHAAAAHGAAPAETGGGCSTTRKCLVNGRVATRCSRWSSNTSNTSKAQSSRESQEADEPEEEQESAEDRPSPMQVLRHARSQLAELTGMAPESCRRSNRPGTAGRWRSRSWRSPGFPTR